ncbi:hypothetical protein [Rhodococcus sovatensis]|uniref:SPW repeat-containing protein n=1 Tax=Rhodococcus sovatensis TaxID=1805840 RepID=A0ABZ2PJ35_9NOCA
MQTTHTNARSPRITNSIWSNIAAVAAAVTGVLAFTGAIGLIGGGTDLGTEVPQRLPWNSIVLAGVALALVVGVPTTAAALALWSAIPRASLITMTAGVLLIVWIVGQIAVIREFSILQVVFGLVGVLLAAVGWHLSRSRTTEDVGNG